MALEEEIREGATQRAGPETAEGWKGNIVARGDSRVLRLFSGSTSIEVTAGFDARLSTPTPGTEELISTVVNEVPQDFVALANALAQLNAVGESSERIASAARALREELAHSSYAAEVRRLLS